MAEYLGMPFFPIVASLIPLPAHIYIRFGEAIRFDLPPEAADDQALVDRLNEHVRSAMQALVDDTLRRRQGIYWSSYDASEEPQTMARPTIVARESAEYAKAA
jgi:hypothetical protein